MDYKKHYDNLIKTRKKLNRKKENDIYYENHHIIPKSCGGTNKSNNLILLTPKEHFIAHLLLTKMYNGLLCNKMNYALWMMCNRLRKDEKIISSKMYENVKKVISKNRKNFRYSDESKKKMSDSAKKRKNGRKRSEETRKKISEKMKGDNNPSRKYGPWNKGLTGIKGTFNRKKIIQITKDGEEIKIWESAKAAEKELNISSSQISTVCNGKRNKTAGGFIWRFFE